RRARRDPAARLRPEEADRGRARVAVLALVLLLAGWLSAPVEPVDRGGPAQPTPPPKAGECKKCHGAGRLPCPEHTKAECELEDKVLFCTFVADCPTCGGAGFVWCETCKKEEAKQAL